MEKSEFLRHLVRCLEKLDIPYFITGAIASIVYGEPRLTNDIDVVAEINESHITKILWECSKSQEI